MKIFKNIVQAMCDYCFGRRERRKRKRRESDKLGYIKTVEDQKDGYYLYNGMYIKDRRKITRRQND